MQIAIFRWTTHCNSMKYYLYIKRKDILPNNMANIFLYIINNQKNVTKISITQQLWADLWWPVGVP